jgi:D-glycero-D-manno-heptose 1,7-bisphosphate phosphatase
MLVLLDRDGVLNEEGPGYVTNPDALVMIAGAAEAVARLCAAGRRIAVVTNQSAVGRGLIDAEMLEHIHEKLCAEVARAGGRIDTIEACPDPPWAATARRKPAPGMLREAIRRFGAEAAATVMIGDSLRDLEAAHAAGCQRILVRSGNGTATQAAGIPAVLSPVAVFNDLATAVDKLLEAE